MKKYCIAFVFLLMVVLSFTSCNAQTGKIPRWVSKNGYWVIESNIYRPLEHVVRLYTNDDQLIYTENLSGVRLDPTRKKVRVKLKKILETALLSWERNHLREANRNYVSSTLK